MKNYILPVENYFGGDGWKMPVAFSTECDLQTLKRKNLSQYIKLMIVVFQKAHNTKSFSQGFSAIELECTYSRMKLNPEIGSTNETITDEHIGSEETLKIKFENHQGIAFDVSEPLPYTESLEPALVGSIQHITLSTSDISLIFEDTDY